MIVERKDIAKTLAEFRSTSKKVVFTNGCFDILHAGHVTYLQQARALGDALFVGLNSDSSVKRLGKGDDRPVQTQKDRALILSSLKAVDFVSIFDEDTPLELIKIVEPNVLVKGGDWPVEKIVGYDWVRSNGGLVRSLPFVPGQSTTGIIQKIKTL